MLRRYLIELNTTNPIQLNPLNLTQSFGVSCYFGVISTDLTCFWCKNIKIFVFCARINLKGVDTTEIGCRILIIPTRKHALLLVLVKVFDRCSPTPLQTVESPPPHQIILFLLVIHLSMFCYLLRNFDS